VEAADPPETVLYTMNHDVSAGRDTKLLGPLPVFVVGIGDVNLQVVPTVFVP
jgi:hypothetical protein